MGGFRILTLYVHFRQFRPNFLSIYGSLRQHWTLILCRFYRYFELCHPVVFYYVDNHKIPVKTQHMTWLEVYGCLSSKPQRDDSIQTVSYSSSVRQSIQDIKNQSSGMLCQHPFRMLCCDWNFRVISVDIAIVTQILFLSFGKLIFILSFGEDPIYFIKAYGLLTYQ